MFWIKTIYFSFEYTQYSIRERPPILGWNSDQIGPSRYAATGCNYYYRLIFKFWLPMCDNFYKSPQCSDQLQLPRIFRTGKYFHIQCWNWIIERNLTWNLFQPDYSGFLPGPYLLFHTTWVCNRESCRAGISHLTLVKIPPPSLLTGCDTQVSLCVHEMSSYKSFHLSGQKPSGWSPETSSL